MGKRHLSVLWFCWGMGDIALMYFYGILITEDGSLTSLAPFRVYKKRFVSNTKTPHTPRHICVQAPTSGRWFQRKYGLGEKPPHLPETIFTTIWKAPPFG